MVVVFLTVMGLGYGWKALEMRPRPYDILNGVRLLIDKDSDFGFPSGHTLIVSGGVVVAWFYLRKSYAIILTAEGPSSRSPESTSGYTSPPTSPGVPYYALDAPLLSDRTLGSSNRSIIGSPVDSRLDASLPAEVDQNSGG